MTKIIKYPPNTSQVKLFTQKQVTFATVAGGILAGSILMAINFQRKGLNKQALTCAIAGMISVACLSVINILIPQLPAFIVIMISFFCIRQCYKNTQSPLFKEHLKNGGNREKTMIVIGVILAVTLMNILIAFGMMCILKLF
jgi:hypothetical protein